MREIYYTAGMCASREEQDVSPGPPPPVAAKSRPDHPGSHMPLVP